MLDARDSMMVLSSEKENVKPLASRVASSATFLAKNVIGRSIADELPVLLASGSGLGSKASYGSSSNSNLKWIEGLPTHSSQPTHRYLESCCGSFRSTSKKRAQEDEFEAFMSSNTPVFAGIEIPASKFSEPRISADDTEIFDFNGKLPTFLQNPSQSTFDWDAVLDSHTDGLWAPESFTATQLHDLKEEEARSMLASTAQTDNHAIFRLRLILGHVVGTVHPTSIVQQHQLAVQRLHDAIAQDRFLTTGAAPKHSDLVQTSSTSASTSTHAFQHEHSTTSGQKNMQESHHQPVVLYNPRIDRDVSKERTTPTFHCSWILCRKVCSLACLLKE
jgi:hypothetical protein